MKQTLSLLSLFVVGLVTVVPLTAHGDHHHHDERDLTALVAPENLTQAPEDQAILRWQARLDREGGDMAATWERLGWAYIAKGRTTLDKGYFALAVELVEQMEERHGESDASRLLLGHAVLQQHRFRETEAIANALVADGTNPRGWALLSDARMERGDLAGAIAACQEFVNRLPGPEAYVRIAHLRWLKGDLAGAEHMMQTALEATGYSAVETSDWMRVRWGGYRLRAGEPADALTLADTVLDRRADYAPALLLRGQARLALGQTTAAIVDLARAAELNPLPEYQWWWADALRERGEDQAAREVESALRNEGRARDPRTLALYLATRDQWLTVAEKLAREEWIERSDPHTRDALAWVLAVQGRTEEAAAFLAPLLEQVPADGRIWLHAALIEHWRGNLDAAQKFAREADRLRGGLLPSEQRRLDQLREAQVGVAPVPNSNI